MKKKFDINTIKRATNKVGVKLQKHSPEILMVAGIIGAVTSAVMACHETTKLSTILDDSKEKVDSIHFAKEHPEKLTEEYTEQDSKKDLAIVYTQTGLQVAKLYAPSVTLGVLSIVSILASNNILRKRNVALAAAYSAVEKSFKEYRGRVVERFGENVDKELRYNIKAKEIEETEVDENGKEKTVKKNIDVIDGVTCSPYAKFFDASSDYWEKNPEYNLMFLKSQQNYANDLLRTRGHLYLNEVYDMLGIPRTKAGQVVGWVYDENNVDGDNYIDFGIYECNRPNRDFVNGFEPVILLDFNVDGNIWEKL